jgi:hypothetical protein
MVSRPTRTGAHRGETMPGKPVTTKAQRQDRLDGIVRLCRFFGRQARGSWTGSAHFRTTRVLAVGRTQVAVSCAVHVVPDGLEGSFGSSVTVWPKGRKRRASQSAGWNAILVRMDWYRACQRALQRHGYRGKWRASPWGRFGDFRKSLKDGHALTAEIAILERIKAEPWASLGAPSNKVMPSARRTMKRSQWKTLRNG